MWRVLLPAQRGALGAEIVVHVTVHVRGKSGSVVSKEYVVRFTFKIYFHASTLLMTFAVAWIPVF